MVSPAGTVSLAADAPAVTVATAAMSALTG